MVVGYFPKTILFLKKKKDPRQKTPIQTPENRIKMVKVEGLNPKCLEPYLKKKVNTLSKNNKKKRKKCTPPFWNISTKKNDVF